MNWTRGSFRVWFVLALAWIALTGWKEYVSKPWNQNWVGTEGECWDRLAKWPDGQRFSEWDALVDEDDIPSNIEIYKKKHAWEAENIPERNRWVRAMREKLMDCEAASPITRRASLQISRIWLSLEDSLPLILLPPIALLIAGCIFYWIIRGFRTSA